MTATYAAPAGLGLSMLPRIIKTLCIKHGARASNLAQRLFLAGPADEAYRSGHDETPISSYTLRQAHPQASASGRPTVPVAIGMPMHRLAPLQPANDVAGAAISDARTVQDMVCMLRGQGLPVTAIAEATRVERKTVYSWIDGKVTVPSEANHLRLLALCNLLSDVPPGSLGLFHRLWERPAGEAATLKTALTGAALDPRGVKAALDALRPAVDRLLASQSRKPTVVGEATPAASLTEYLEASVP